MKATRIPGTKSFNLTISIDEIGSLLHESKAVQNHLYETLVAASNGFYFPKKTDTNQKVMSSLDLPYNKIIDPSPEGELEDLIERAICLPFYEAILLVAKERKFVMPIDTESYVFIQEKYDWDNDTTYDNRKYIIEKLLEWSYVDSCD
jgi:hypothetical protein